MERYLYHYTSIDTLEKILSNKTLQFSTLATVDDLDEVETADINKFGRFCYVSCWTREETESIPMWKMYTPDMQGVRIRMREYPFKHYVIQPGEQNNSNMIETYIDLIGRAARDLSCISPDNPKLVEIDYTEKEKLLYPQVKFESSTYTTDTVFENGQKKTVTKTNSTIRYDASNIGLFKRKCWAFQAEWRYKILAAPYTYKELAACKTKDDQMLLMQRLEDDSYTPKEEKIFLDLDDSAICEMEILVGPRATQEQLEEVRAMAKNYGIDESQIKVSSLRIR